MSNERAHALDRMRSALGALVLADARHRQELRRRLQVGEEELSALLFLARHGAVPQPRLREASGLSRSGAGAMIQRLEERDYVRRWTDRRDRRLRFVELTPAGSAALDRASGAWDDRLAGALEAHSTEDVVALADALRTIAGDSESVADELVDGAESAGAEPIWRHWG